MPKFTTSRRSQAGSTRLPLLLTAAATTMLGSALPAQAQSPILYLRADDPTHITVVNGRVTAWTNEASGAQVFTSDSTQNPSFISSAVNGLPTVRFNGATENDVLRSLGFGASAQELTLFIVTAPNSNSGNYRALFSGISSSTPGNQDYNSGINIDQGAGATSTFNTLNVEGAKGGGGGGANLRTSSSAFGTYNLLSVGYGNTAATLYVNGNQEGSRGNNGNPVSLQDVRVGGRYYDNGGGPYETGFLDGDISEIQVYDLLLTDTQRQTVERSLINKYGLPGATTATAPEPGALALLATSLPLFAYGCARRRSRAGNRLSNA